MSLLDTGPETLVIRPAVRDTDDDGNQRWRDWRDGDTEYRVTGVQVQYVESDTEHVHGQRITSDVTAIFRKLPHSLDPGDVEYASIVWDGRTWEVQGELRQYRRGRLTRHVQLALREVR